MLERTVLTTAALHARPLDRFVRAARTFASKITLRRGEKEADGVAVMQLLLLAVPGGARVTLIVEGPDEAEAAEALASLLEAPEEGVPAAPPDPPPGPRAAGRIGTPGAPGRGAGLARFEARRDAALLTARSPREERGRLERGLAAAVAATDALASDDDPFCDIFRAQRTLLDDPQLRQELLQAADRGQPAEQAVRSVFGDLAARFDRLDSDFAADRHADVADLRDRILEALGLEVQGDLGGGAAVVWILREATPSRMATLDMGRVAGVISRRGGPTSHAAIVARSRGVPLIFAGAELLRGISEGDPLEVDGETGRISPASAEDARRAPRAGEIARRGPAAGSDLGVTLRANLGTPGDLAAARRAGCDGCGLLRTELLYAGRAAPPSVDEQADAYVRIARALSPHPVVVRLFDAGSDKPLPFLDCPEGEPNPALGTRGVRLLLQNPEVLAGQLAAIRQAREAAGCDLRAMVPMVVDGQDLARVRHAAPGAEDLPLGAMIETPAAALLCAAICRDASFVSIGSNDLAQYTLASDRGLSLEGGPLHPAVLALVRRVAREARAGGVECSVCGEMAGDPTTAALLAGLGVVTLSMAPIRIPAVREELGRLSRAELEARASEAAALDDPAALSALIRGWAT